jgi:hypothetical protein
MNKSLLITRPNHDCATNYLYFWSQYVINEAAKKHIPVYDLKRIKATRAEFDSFLRSRQPGFIFFNGHGNATTITGFNNEPLLGSNIIQKFVKDTIIYARSCEAGKILGIKLIENGTRVFIGYKRKFLCGLTPSKITKPLTDPLAKLFLEPSNLVPTTLIKGHTAKKAHERSKSAMQKNFRRMISTAATEEERYAARWLYGNMKCQVLYGDQNAAL